MKKIAFFSLLAVFLFAPLGHAEMAMDAGNAMCPVSGDKVSGKDFVEHGGQKYGICCAMCANKFNKDPEKYISEMSSESHEGHDHSMM